jgi:uncharacterized phage protein (TIGR02220 family)
MENEIKEKKQPAELNAQQVLDRMNHHLGKPNHFKAKNMNANLLKERMKENTVPDLVRYVDYIWQEWANWELRNKFYKPDSIFRKSNFDKHFPHITFKSTHPPPSEAEFFSKSVTLNDYQKYLLRPGGYYGYHYLSLNDQGRLKVDNRIRESFKQDKSVNCAIGVHWFEDIRKEFHGRYEN